MRRSLTYVLLVGALAACTTDASTPNPDAAPGGSQPDGTEPAPGSCVPGEALPVVSLVAAGKNISPTFGIGSSECATVNGRGYIAFDYDPVLVDTTGAIEVQVDGDAKVALTWPAGEPFTQTKPGHWRSSTPAKGCSRLTVMVESPSGATSETVGADIRVGGVNVECPQRGLGPIEPIDTSVIITEAPDTTLGTNRQRKVVETTVVANTNP
jgi:hypothetical protein